MSGRDPAGDGNPAPHEAFEKAFEEVARRGQAQRAALEAHGARLDELRGQLNGVRARAEALQTDGHGRAARRLLRQEGQPVAQALQAALTRNAELTAALEASIAELDAVKRELEPNAGGDDASPG